MRRRTHAALVCVLVRGANAIAASVCVCSTLYAQRARTPEAASVSAVNDVRRADSLLRIGEIVRAEALYYAATYTSPEDPQSRLALATYLAARGRFAVAHALLDEALEFGADSSIVARLRAPLLRVESSWAALLALRPSHRSRDEHERLAWLADHQTTVSGSDSTTIAFHPSSVIGLGRVAIVVGGDTLAVDIDAATDEIVVGSSRDGDSYIKRFGADSVGGLAAVRRVAIGGLVLENVPVRVDPSLGSERARIGLATLARFAPTVDGPAGVITLRRDGRIRSPRGERIPVLLQFPGVAIARHGRLLSLDSAAGRAVLAEARWTLDVRRGELVLEGDG